MKEKLAFPAKGKGPLARCLVRLLDCYIPRCLGILRINFYTLKNISGLQTATQLHVI